MTTLLLLAIALAMDAFAVSLVKGATCRLGWQGSLSIGLAFGTAQGVMPLIGWALGLAFAGLIASVDHWIAFALLGFLGFKMLREAFSGGTEAGDSPLDLSIHAILVAAIATSIDAAAAGLSLPLLDLPVLIACIAIGVVSAVLCTAGCRLGCRLGTRLGKPAEIFGGVVLIGLGVKILTTHLSA